jgi:CubicO group peptidase (beta-lactamase class C family)
MKPYHLQRAILPLVALALLLLNSLLPFPSAAQAASSLDANARQQIIEAALRALNDNYVFPEIAQQMEQDIRARWQRKEYDGITDGAVFAATLTEHLRAICHDKHLRVTFSTAALPKRNNPRLPMPEEIATQRAAAAARNFGFEKVVRLGGNIGYIDVRAFVPAELGSETAAAALNFLANTDALIFDLRQNGGGNPAMVALLSSYLFDKPTHLNDIYSRPQNRTEEFWTRAEVVGKRYGERRPVYVLTSNRTFSAGEEFTYNLKNLKRATIIGETTGGGAHPVNFYPLNDHFSIGVPIARAINPITKTNWEGVGVKPDVEVPAAQALKTAHLAALKQVLAKTNDARRAQELQAVIETVQREMDETKPVAVQTAAPAQPPQPPAAGESTTALPNTPAGKALDAFLKALNSGNLDALKRFHQERGGNPENAQQDFGLYQQSGGLKLHSVTRSTDYEIEVLVQAKKDGHWLNFGIGVESQAPHPIADIRIRPTSAPSAAPAPTAPAPKVKNEAELLKGLSTLLDEQSAADNFSGVALVAKAGQPIFQKAVGLANKAYKVPNQLDTKFNLGSVNKIFTRIAILQLAEQGKLTLDDTLGKHLPDYPNKQAAEKVTIKHLLDMRSGIGDIFGPKFDATPKDRLRAIKDYLPLFADQPLLFEPGSSSRYSNGGYIVLGAIIERITGQSYYDYVREHIFKPAGMNNTDSYEEDAGVPNLATGYRRNERGQRVSNIYTKPARGSSAGGGYSTAEDLLKFSLALQAGKLLSASNTKRLVGGGLGIAGGAPGIAAALEIDPASGYTIVVLSNYDQPSATGLSKQIRQRVADIK